MEKEIVVDVKDVCKIYESGSGRTRVLDKVNVSIKKGEFVGIVGDSGSGKTTLLNLVGGMDCVSSGTITVAGDVISKYNDQQRTAYRRRRVGFTHIFYINYNFFLHINLLLLPACPYPGKEILFLIHQSI